MGIKVVGAGFGRTGTLSLALALEELGFSKCHHMRELNNVSAQAKIWKSISEGADVDWSQIFKGYQACVDWPSSIYWKPLVKFYPDSKVILTTRSEESWYRSTYDTIYPKTAKASKIKLLFNRKFKNKVDMCNNAIWNGIFEGRFEDRDFAIQKFRDHIEQVTKAIPEDRLLVFNVSQGWQPLCDFLNAPIPDLPFPHVNESDKSTGNQNQSLVLKDLHL